MKTFVLNILALLFTLSLNAQSFTRGWANCYSDPTATTYITDVTADKNGNTYSVGYKIYNGDEYYQTHLFVRKVTPTGQEEWIQYFNATQDSIDNAKAVALDNAGNIYVTGTRKDTFCNICTYNTKISDIITMKYNPQGQRLWLNRYKPGLNIISYPSAIHVLPNGTSVVAGNEDVLNTQTYVWERRAVIMQITNAGNTTWVRKVESTVANSVTVFGDGNIYVAGANDQYHYFMTYKPLLLKLKKNGVVQWTNTFDEPNKRGQYFFVKTDASGNVYVNGETDTVAFANAPAMLTTKINPVSGTNIWSKKETGTSTSNTQGSYTVDSAGNSFTAGTVAPGGYFTDWVLTGYNTNGESIWTNYYAGALGGSDAPVDIQTDASGNVYVAGNTYGPVNNRYSYTLNVYNAKGALTYQNLYQNGNRIIIPAGLGLDSKGNVYVIGNCTVKYKPVQSIAAQQVNTDLLNTPIGKPVRIYPNPAKDVVNIDHGFGTGNIIWRLLDNTGKVLQQQTTAAKPVINLPVNHLKAGTYFIQVTAGKEQYTKKFIKL